MKTFILMLILCPLLFGQYHYLKINFSEPMDTSTTKVKTNYTVFNNEMQEISIYRVGIPLQPDGVTLDNTAVVLEIKHLSYKTNISIRAINVADLAGNAIGENNSVWFYFDGFDPVNEIKPYIIIEPKGT